MEKESKKNTYTKLIIILLIIFIALFIYDKHDEWQQEKKEKELIKDAVEAIEKINNRQF